MKHTILPEEQPASSISFAVQSRSRELPTWIILPTRYEQEELARHRITTLRKSMDFVPGYEARPVRIESTVTVLEVQQ